MINSSPRQSATTEKYAIELVQVPHWRETGQLHSFFQCVSGFDFVRVFLVLYSHIAVTSVHVGSVQLITELTHVVFLVL